jgi:hypothetical protein
MKNLALAQFCRSGKIKIVQGIIIRIILRTKNKWNYVVTIIKISCKFVRNRFGKNGARHSLVNACTRLVHGTSFIMQSAVVLFK